MLSKTLLALVAAAAPAVLAQSSTPNLTALVASDNRLSTLGKILYAYPDVARNLSMAQNVTAFLPTNAAFDDYLKSNKNVSLSSLSTDLVSALLDYHVVNGTVMSSNITDSPHFFHTFLTDPTYSTVENGQVLEFQMVDGHAVITSGYKTQARIVGSAMNYTNGTAWVIDSVNVIPPNYTDIASAANLSYFLGAVQRAGLTQTIAGLDDVTIFAPTNDAFESVGSIFSNMSDSKLADILKAHVINGTIAYSPSIGNGSVDTLGGKVNLTVADGAIFVDQARVVNADNLISNGVLHVINAVINPNGTTKANPSDNNAQNAFSGATTVSVLTEFFRSPKATTTVQNLVTTTLDVANGYSTVTKAIGSGAGGPGATSSGGAAAPAVTGAIGMAALFGGAAFVMDL